MVSEGISPGYGGVVCIDKCFQMMMRKIVTMMMMSERQFCCSLVPHALRPTIVAAYD